MILYSVPRNSTYRRATLISAQGGSQRPRADAVTGQSLDAAPLCPCRVCAPWAWPVPCVLYPPIS